MHILSIKPELILYFFMFSCFALLLFNIAYIFLDNAGRVRLESRQLDMADEITAQIHRLSEGDTVTDTHLAYLRKKLKRVRFMKIFEQSMQEVQRQQPQALCRQYLNQLRPAFLSLATAYERHDHIEQSYFASIITQFEIDRGQVVFDGIIGFCLGKISQKEVSLRENSLKALYSIGNPDAILSAWNLMDIHEIQHSNKLLSDGLLKFTGDQSELALLLFQHRREYSDRLLLPVMQFIYYFSGSYQRDFLEILEDSSADKELQLEALRYFRKYPYEPARKTIQSFLRYRGLVDWEHTAIAALALSGYPGPDTVDCLKEALSDHNWYIRLNSADTLIHGLKVSQVQLHDVYNGRDRFAKEILLYVSSQAELIHQEMELTKNYV